MLTNEFINSFIDSKKASHIKQETQHKIKKLTDTTNERKTDHLFWFIYNIIYPDNIVKNKFLEEKQIKFKWMEMINNDKKLCKKIQKCTTFFNYTQ